MILTLWWHTFQLLKSAFYVATYYTYNTTLPLKCCQVFFEILFKFFFCIAFLYCFLNWLNTTTKLFRLQVFFEIFLNLFCKRCTYKVCSVFFFLLLSYKACKR